MKPIAFKKTIALVATFALLSGSVYGAEVTENWTKHCTSCHGKDGKGQTKAGRAADVKDLTDAKYQATFTDEQMFKQIKEGMKDAKGKEKMKPFADKLSDDEIKALVSFVRGLKK
jgi:mono/diheme cytochrome c family protein